MTKFKQPKTDITFMVSNRTFSVERFDRFVEKELLLMEGRAQMEFMEESRNAIERVAELRGTLSLLEKELGQVAAVEALLQDSVIPHRRKVKALSAVGVTRGFTKAQTGLMIETAQEKREGLLRAVLETESLLSKWKVTVREFTLTPLPERQPALSQRGLLAELRKVFLEFSKEQEAHRALLRERKEKEEGASPEEKRALRKNKPQAPKLLVEPLPRWLRFGLADLLWQTFVENKEG